MKKIVLIVSFVASSAILLAQAKATKELQDKFEGSLSLYFYKNTLRMLNQSDDKDFDEMINNIEKLKFLMVEKSTKKFGDKEYRKLQRDYKTEDYETVMTGRFQGRDFDVYIKDKQGSTPGTVVLVNDSTNLYVLDMVGTIDVTKASSLFSAIDESTDIGKRIRNFTDHKGKKGKKDMDSVKVGH